MTSQELRNFNLPDTPGIYFFKQGSKILYVGKATSLRDRVRSYFSAELELTRGPAIVQMVELADNVTFIETDSVLEALILEAVQIKKHKPKYNVRERDDRSFNYVILTKEDFPRLITARGKQVADDADLKKQTKYKFGPFPFGGELKEALKIIRRIIPYRDKCVPAPEMIAKGKKPKPCFNSQIGLCPGVCSGAVSTEAYAETVVNLRRLFSGHKKEVIRQFEREMKVAAKNQEFERAALLKRKIFALNHIQDVSLIKYRGAPGRTGSFRAEAYDIAHLSGKDTVGVMTVTLDGELDKSSYRKFTIRGQGKEVSNDTENLREVLIRRFNHDEWQMPSVIVLDGGKQQLNVGRKILAAMEIAVPVVAVVKDEFHRAREIIGDDQKFIREHEREIILANSEAHRFAIHFHRQKRRAVL
jgi:excinuclease ABC subunit C